MSFDEWNSGGELAPSPSLLQVHGGWFKPLGGDFQPGAAGLHDLHGLPGRSFDREGEGLVDRNDRRQFRGEVNNMIKFTFNVNSA